MQGGAGERVGRVDPRSRRSRSRSRSLLRRHCRRATTGRLRQLPLLLQSASSASSLRLSGSQPVQSFTASWPAALAGLFANHVTLRVLELWVGFV